MGHTTYSDQAMAILRDAVETNLAGDLAAERAGGLAMNPPMRRTPDELRELARTPLTATRSAIAREALERHGFTATGTDETGATIYRAEPTPAGAIWRRDERRSFAWLTLSGSGRRVPVNPRHVMRVVMEESHVNTFVTVVAFSDGSTIAVRESDEDVIALLEAVAA